MPRKTESTPSAPAGLPNYRKAVLEELVIVNRHGQPAIVIGPDRSLNPTIRMYDGAGVERLRLWLDQSGHPIVSISDVAGHHVYESEDAEGLRNQNAYQSMAWDIAKLDQHFFGIELLKAISRVVATYQSALQHGAAHEGGEPR